MIIYQKKIFLIYLPGSTGFFLDSVLDLLHLCDLSLMLGVPIQHEDEALLPSQQPP